VLVIIGFAAARPDEAVELRFKLAHTHQNTFLRIEWRVALSGSAVPAMR